MRRKPWEHRAGLSGDKGSKSGTERPSTLNQRLPPAASTAPATATMPLSLQRPHMAAASLATSIAAHDNLPPSVAPRRPFWPFWPPWPHADNGDDTSALSSRARSGLLQRAGGDVLPRRGQLRARNPPLLAVDTARRVTCVHQRALRSRLPSHHGRVRGRVTACTVLSPPRRRCGLATMFSAAAPCECRRVERRPQLMPSAASYRWCWREAGVLVSTATAAIAGDVSRAARVAVVCPQIPTRSVTFTPQPKITDRPPDLDTPPVAPRVALHPTIQSGHERNFPDWVRARHFPAFLSSSNFQRPNVQL